MHRPQMFVYSGNSRSMLHWMEKRMKDPNGVENMPSILFAVDAFSFTRPFSAPFLEK